MTESLDIVSTRPRKGVARGSAFGEGELSMSPCGRCRRSEVPWELRRFGDKSICRTCYSATIELARGAIKVMPATDKCRLCSNCRAMQDPSLGSAWCTLTELGNERARICENFVSTRRETLREGIEDARALALEIWSRASERLRSNVGEPSFRMWFGGVEALEVAQEKLILSVPDAETREWLEQRLEPVVRGALIAAGRPDLTPAYEISAPAQDPPVAAQSNGHRRLTHGFNPHYRFEEFIVGSGNRLAHASALACVDKPGEVYNPLVLYGGVGVGKTHLLQAIGQEAIHQGHEVLYVTSETFTNELIAAIRDGSTNDFRERYRSVDYLLLDDIQFIAGKEATQEEFFHTFNTLHQSRKQIVLTSDRPPGELRVLEARLRSRFEWGLTADIQPPDLETRIAIARSKAAIRGRRLPETALTALATRAGRNVRELEGALNRVFALSDLLEIEPGMEVVRQVLGEPEDADSSCNPADVLQAVSAYYRVKTSELSGPQRERRIAYARQVAMYLLREEAKLSLVEIGNQLGGRNHSTVIYSYDKIAESRSRGRVKQDLLAVKQLIYGVR